MSERAAPWVSFTLCVVLLAGCGAGSHAAAEESDGHPTATNTTATAPKTTTVPPPYSFDGSVPPPPLLNTGTDYAAIFRSLSARARWAESHDPDAAVADEIYAAGTTRDGFVSDLRLLRRDNHRLVNVGAALDVAVQSISAPLVSLRLKETVSALQLVDGQGQVVDSKVFTGPLTWTVVMSQDTTGRWRIASVEPADDATRVAL